MMSYCELISGETVSWSRILQKCIDGTFRKDEMDRWKEWTQDWITCAVGMQESEIEREKEGYSVGAPKDEELRSLGMEFTEAFLSKKFEEAKEILSEIDKRTAEILEES